MRHFLSQEWELWPDKEIFGIISLVYDHDKRDLVDNLIDLQHQFLGKVISSLHVHIDSHNCLEIIVVKGQKSDIKELAQKLIGVKGIKQGHFKPINL